MKHTNPYTAAARIIAAVFAFITLPGCDSLNEWLAPDRVDYQSARAAPSLSVPPDLTPLPRHDYFSVPALAPALPADRSARQPLPIRVERNGDRYWLIVEGMAAEQLWPLLRDFWSQNGFVLTKDQPEIGVIETGWAENRAQIPNDWFRRAFGKWVDGLYSSGMQDQFRTLVERGDTGTTIISITHKGMEETLTGAQRDSSRWQPRPRAPALELALLNRLIEKFGLTAAQAQQLTANARQAPPRARLFDAGVKAPAIDLREPFDLAWLHVGLALDRTRFAVEKRRRKQGQGFYYVRFAGSRQAKRQSIFGKLFAAKNKRPAQLYPIVLRPAGAAINQVGQVCQIFIVDANGQIDQSPQARRIIAALYEQLN